MRKLSNYYLTLVVILLYFPIFYLMFYSFNSAGSMSSFDSFTVEHYLNIFTDTRLIVIILNTLAVALISSAAAALIGLGGALFLYNVKHSTRHLLLSINNIMIVSPDVIIGASLLILFTVLGISLGPVSVILAHIAFSVPIVVLMILPKLYNMNRSLVDAARDLGADSKTIILKVIIPFIKPGIIAGFFMALTYSLDDFAVTFFVTGSGFSVLSVEIYAMARRGITLEINAVSTLIFIFVLSLVFIYYLLSTRNQMKRGTVK
ncbi:Spermidine/putrescine transport system permease protein PotB [Jeotgalicoccus saudimassiliensis]|uniref:Spermidine/putrescine transport system permease protein PotB n=1 Tax=Jeotgalicoccus saudimassiliensis TaxID=1461582 RepID=A0A078M3M2_9STAP|nr:ABC transporter permease [Jeotgalicoccus saudimassiliensis]CDZ99321.1 Spermidine/putrescine transport system permease protein PotB [Jeotgalicoccus saudimassiliensis]